MEDTEEVKNKNGLMGLVDLLWKRRQFIVVGTLAMTILTVIVVLLLPKVYLSRAVISLSTIRKADSSDELPRSMDIPIFKRCTDMFQNLSLFLNYSQIKGFKGDWQTDKWEQDAEFFSEHLKPIYAFEVEERGVKAVENSVMGIVIESEDGSPQLAREKTEILGHYILNTILNMQIGQYIDTISIKSQAAIEQMKKAIINLQRETVYLKEKESLLVNDLLKLPGIGATTNRELVTADVNSERYLSPQQQLIAVKMSIKENEIQIDRNQKNAEVEQLMLNYLEKVQYLFQNETKFLIKESLLDTLIKEKEKFFATRTDNESKLASYTFATQFYYFQKLRSTVYKFISEPTLPDKHIKPKRKRLVLGGLVVSFFLFSFIAFLLEVSDNPKKGNARE